MGIAMLNPSYRAMEVNMIILRKAGERGHAQQGWLESWHSFSFADRNGRTFN